MKKLVLLLLLLILTTCSEHQVKAQYIEVISGVPLVKSTIGNKNVYFLLDTGTFYNFIDSCRVSSIGAKIDTTQKIPLEFIHTLGGVSSANLLSDIKLTVGYNKYTTSFYSMNLDDLFKQIKKDTGRDVIGILGTSFLISHDAVITFKSNEVLLN